MRIRHNQATSGASPLAAHVDGVLAGCELPARAALRGASLAASGGTATALAALALELPRYAPERVHGYVLPGAVLAGIAARLAAISPAARDALPGIDPGRGAILPAGAIVLDRVRAATGNDAILVTDHGVRHGYLRAALARAGVALDPGINPRGIVRQSPRSPPARGAARRTVRRDRSRGRSHRGQLGER